MDVQEDNPTTVIYLGSHPLGSVSLLQSCGSPERQLRGPAEPGNPGGLSGVSHPKLGHEMRAQVPSKETLAAWSNRGGMRRGQGYLLDLQGEAQSARGCVLNWKADFRPPEASFRASLSAPCSEPSDTATASPGEPVKNRFFVCGHLVSLMDANSISFQSPGL